ncbi:hypothetical protein B0A55_00442 [Friedmanniomyces simplex]|uniref:Uncharacterized protein n=1 Tax=Friedmanniomyces simplex TaxID=329884 RepID=A0A4U0Y7K1_9PEZI|nr:hypothetical protein B0A55_00442 [Friedmanniomyces simplex]
MSTSHGFAKSHDAETPIEQPPPVYDGRRPSALASRRQREPGPLQPTGPAPASRAIVAQQQQPQGHIDQDVSVLFSWSPDSVRPDLAEQGARPSPKESPLTSPKFEASLIEAAPKLVEAWRAVNGAKDELIESLGEELKRLEEEKEELRQGLYKPSKRSEKLPVSGQDDEGKGQEWDEDYDLSPVRAKDALARRRDSWGIPAQMPKSGNTGSDDTFASMEQATDFSIDPGRKPTRRAAPDGLKQKPIPTPADNTAKQSVPGKNPGTVNEQLLELQVKLRLMPAIVLLSHPHNPKVNSPSSASSPADLLAVETAQQSVRSALSLVRGETGGKTPAGRALMGLCEFYMGICRFAKGGILGRDERAAEWFAAASVDAAGVYPEAQSAQRWLEASRGAAGSTAGSPVGGSPARILSGFWPRSRANTGGAGPGTGRSVRFSDTPKTASSGSARSRTADEVPGSAGSWVSAVWESVRRMTGREDVGKSPPLDYLREENERSPTHNDRPSPRFASSFTVKDLDEYGRPRSRAGGPGVGSGENGDRGILGGLRLADPNSGDRDGAHAALAQETERAPDSPPRRISYRITNLDLSSSSSEGTGAASPPPPPPRCTQSYEPAESPHGTPAAQQPRDGPSPNATSPQSPSKRRSIAFSLPFTGNPTHNQPPASSPQVSPTLSIDSATAMAKRVTRRLSTIATGRDAKRPDLMEMAEEGQSPYRSTFKPIGEEGEGWEMRKRKKSAEEMV